jgi:phenylacetate-CoA ligase
MNSITEKIFPGNRFVGIIRDTLLYSRYYMDAKRTIRKIESMSEEDIRSYQFNRLKKIITYAHEHVPYYKELFNNIGFKPAHFKQIEDIKHIPYLTKSIFREKYHQMIANDLPASHFKSTVTGGSTGAPMELFLDRRTSTPAEFAYLQYIWKRIGYRFRDRCVVLRGDFIETPEDGISFWKRNLPINWLVMSSFRLKENLLPSYLEKIRNFAPKFIIAYPSTAYVLANYIQSNKLPGIESLKGVICSSETLYTWQRNFISNALKVKVMAYYGLTEKCCLAAHCNDSNFYEFLPTYGFVEFINKSNLWCNEDGETGEIVATGLNSMAAPIIRYRTQDMCIYSEKTCGTHAGWSTVKEITGRISEFLVDKSDNLITFTCSDELFWSIINKINAYQFVQNTHGKLQIKLDLKHPLTTAEVKEIKGTCHDYYPGFEVELTENEYIPRTRSGKFRYLIQNLPIDFNSNA